MTFTQCANLNTHIGTCIEKPSSKRNSTNKPILQHENVEQKLKEIITYNSSPRAIPKES